MTRAEASRNMSGFALTGTMIFSSSLGRELTSAMLPYRSDESTSANTGAVRRDTCHLPMMTQIHSQQDDSGDPAAVPYAIRQNDRHFSLSDKGKVQVLDNRRSNSNQALVAPRSMSMLGSGPARPKRWNF